MPTVLLRGQVKLAPYANWLYLNERAGCWLGNHLIADHPEIKAHLTTRVADAKITMIPYGADRIDNPDSGVLAQYGLQPGGYAMVIARPEPENSILETVAAFSRKPRGMKLVVLGQYDPQKMLYHKQVRDAASDEVLFPGAIYEKATVSALRFHSAIYAHGHQVGGTNPSLVEAMGAGSAVLAHGNHSIAGWPVPARGISRASGNAPTSWMPSSPTRPRSSACARRAASGMGRCLRGRGCWGSMRGCWRGGRRVDSRERCGSFLTASYRSVFRPTFRAKARPTRPRSSACARRAASGMGRCLRGSGCWGSTRTFCPQAQGSRYKVQVKGDGGRVPRGPSFSTGNLRCTRQVNRG